MDNEIAIEYCREAARIKEDSLLSAKGHYNVAARWQYVHLWIGIPNAVLAAIAGLSAFQGCDLVAGALAILVAAITSISTFLNPSGRSSVHKRCAAEYHALRNKARIFINITYRRSQSEYELNAKFEEMVSKRDDLNATSPQIPEWAYKKAKAGVKAGESSYRE